MWDILKDANLHSVIFLLHSIKSAIQKRGTECGEQRKSSRRFRGMFKKIEYPGESSRRFWGIFKKNLGNARKEISGECSKRFRGMLEKIPGMFDRIPANIRKNFGNLNFYLFREILLIFYQTLQSNYYKTKK